MRAAVDKDLFLFCRGVLGYDRLVERIHGPVCARLMDKRHRRVMLTMPRGSYKSTVCSIGYPAWRGCLDPEHYTCLLVMNTELNAQEKLAELKKHFEGNEMLRALYPEAIPDFRNVPWGARSAMLRRVENASGTPTYQVLGGSGQGISKHVDEIILDDLATPSRDDYTETEILPDRRMISQAIGYVKTAFSLFKDQKTGRMLIVGTRAAKADVVDYALKNLPAFARNYLELSAENADGTPAMPEIFDAEALQELRETMGAVIYSLWYRNVPVDASEVIFRLTDANWYERGSITPEDIRNMRVYTAIDLSSGSTGRGANNTAIVTVGVDPSGVAYVLDMEYGQWEPTVMIEKLFAIKDYYQPLRIGMEKAGFQVFVQRLLPYFMKMYGDQLPIQPMKRSNQISKTLRLLTIQPWVERGDLKLPRGTKCKPLVEEMEEFRMDEKRRGADDALDALADCLKLARVGVQAESTVIERRHRYTAEEIERLCAEAFSPDAAVKELHQRAEEAHGGKYADPQMRGRAFAYLGRS